MVWRQPVFRVFLARGYHAATLDEIADEAAFSRGVVQSRFGNKADLFLALLEERIAERAAQNARLADGLSGAQGMRVLREHAARRNRAELDWGLLLIEFRVHAARDPELSLRERLRALLACAIERSPFHARRLRGIDPGRFEPADLARLPVTSKEQMMTGWDELATDRRLTRTRTEAQLVTCADEPSPLDGRYVCLASGGSSGLRGLFVQTIEEFVEFSASILPRLVARLAAAGPPPLRLAIRSARSPRRPRCRWPPSCSGSTKCGRWSSWRTPPSWRCSPRNSAPGGWRSPVSVTAMGEQLTEQNQAVITEAFEVPVVNQFTSTEGLIGHSEPGGAVISFASDMCIAELVDAGNRPVPDGTPSAKVLLTKLYNHTQPLIRYELTDRFTRHPAGPGHGQLRATVEGRADDTFRYGTIAVDPLAVRTVMVRTPAALEYQVRRTSGGIDVAVVASGPLNHAALAVRLEQSLRAAGLHDPQVHLRQVLDIIRHPQTGKARRFIPL